MSNSFHKVFILYSLLELRNFLHGNELAGIKGLIYNVLSFILGLFNYTPIVFITLFTDRQIRILQILLPVRKYLFMVCERDLCLTVGVVGDYM